MFLASSITVLFFFRPDDEVKSSKYIVKINITEEVLRVKGYYLHDNI